MVRQGQKESKTEALVDRAIVKALTSGKAGARGLTLPGLLAPILENVKDNMRQASLARLSLGCLSAASRLPLGPSKNSGSNNEDEGERARRASRARTGQAAASRRRCSRKTVDLPTIST